MSPDQSDEPMFHPALLYYPVEKNLWLGLQVTKMVSENINTTFCEHVHVRYMLSPVRLSVVCRLSSVCLSVCLSVTFVRPTQAV